MKYQNNSLLGYCYNELINLAIFVADGKEVTM